jgi:hypothetical protein
MPATELMLDAPLLFFVLFLILINRVLRFLAGGLPPQVRARRAVRDGTVEAAIYWGFSVQRCRDSQQLFTIS